MNKLFIKLYDSNDRLTNTAELSIEKNHELGRLESVIRDFAPTVLDEGGRLDYSFSEDVPERLQEMVMSDVRWAQSQCLDDVVYLSFRVYGAMISFYYCSLEEKVADDHQIEGTTYTI
ncbi:MAG: hypothetical protein ACOYKA_01280 [Legionellaceae bacterium]